MASQYEKVAATLVDIRKIRLAYLMFCLPRNTRMRPQGKTVNIAIHLYEQFLAKKLHRNFLSESFFRSKIAESGERKWIVLRYGLDI